MSLHVDGISGQSTQTITAPTAIIKFDGVQIGAVQNIAASVDYNVVDVDELGNALTARFVPGVTKVTGQAEQAFIEPDIFFDLLPAAVLQEGVEQLSNLFPVFNGPGAGQQLTQGVLDSFAGKAIARNLSLNSNSHSRISQAKQFLASQALKYIQTQTIFFDIDMQDGLGTSVHLLRDVVLAGRSVRLDTNNIIMMTTLHFHARMMI